MERVFGANHPDPLEIENTKKVLKVNLNFKMIFSFSIIFMTDPSTWFMQEHEQALIDAIAKLSNISDGGESGIFQPILCHSS